MLILNAYTLKFPKTLTIYNKIEIPKLNKSFIYLQNTAFIIRNQDKKNINAI